MKKKFPRVSVQIINWNGKKFLKDCFDGLLKQNYPNFEAVLVDNASSDGSIELMEKNYKTQLKNGKVKIIKLDKNYGFAGGYNRSYEQTSADYVIFLNNDTIIPQKNFLKLLVSAAIKNNAALVGAWEQPIEKPKRKERNLYPTMGLLGFHVEEVLYKNNCLLIGGGCFLVDKKKIKYLFLDEYFAYGEDSYLSWKTRLAALKGIYEKRAVYLHYGAGSSGRRSRIIRYNAEKNRIVNLLVFYEGITLLKILPLLIFELFVKLVYSLRSRTLFNSLISALFWDIKNASLILSERKSMQRRRLISDKEILALMSYKIFPEHISGKIARFLNNLTRHYCKIFSLNTYDLY
jgi:GT2 family glycosyltransferase